MCVSRSSGTCPGTTLNSVEFRCVLVLVVLLLACAMMPFLSRIRPCYRAKARGGASREHPVGPTFPTRERKLANPRLHSRFSQLPRRKFTPPVTSSCEHISHSSCNSLDEVHQVRLDSAQRIIVPDTPSVAHSHPACVCRSAQFCTVQEHGGGERCALPAKAGRRLARTARLPRRGERWQETRQERAT